MGIHLRLDPDEPGFIIGGIHCRLLHRQAGAGLHTRGLAVERRLVQATAVRRSYSSCFFNLFSALRMGVAS